MWRTIRRIHASITAPCATCRDILFGLFGTCYGRRGGDHIGDQSRDATCGKDCLGGPTTCTGAWTHRARSDIQGRVGVQGRRVGESQLRGPATYRGSNSRDRCVEGARRLGGLLGRLSLSPFRARFVEFLFGNGDQLPG